MGGEGRYGVALGRSVCVDVKCVGGVCVEEVVSFVYGVCDVDGWVCMFGGVHLYMGTAVVCLYRNRNRCV